MDENYSMCDFTYGYDSLADAKPTYARAHAHGTTYLTVYIYTYDFTRAHTPVRFAFSRLTAVDR